MLALVCHYRPAASGGGWTAWTRQPESACAPVVAGQVVSEIELRTIGLGLATKGLLGHDQIVVARFIRKVSLASRLRATPLRVDLNGTDQHLITAELADGPHIIGLPSCLRSLMPATTGPEGGGMDTRDLIPSNLHGAFSSVQIETIDYRC